MVCHYYRIYHVLTTVFSFLHCVLDEISFCEVLLQCCSRSNCLEFFWTQMIISLLFVIRGYNYWLKVILRMEKSHLLLTFWKKWQVRILPWTFSYNFSVYDMALVLVCHRVLSLDVCGVDVPPCTGSKNWYWQMVWEPWKNAEGMWSGTSITSRGSCNSCKYMFL